MWGNISPEANLQARAEVKIKPESQISCHITLTECNKWFLLSYISSLL